MTVIRNAKINKDIDFEGEWAFLEGDVVQITSLPTDPVDGLRRYMAVSKRINREVEITGEDIGSGPRRGGTPGRSITPAQKSQRLIPSSADLPANTVGKAESLMAAFSGNRAVLIAGLRDAIDSSEALLQFKDEEASDDETVCKVFFKSKEAYKAFRKASEKTGTPRRTDGTIIEIVGLEELKPDLSQSLVSCVDNALLSSVAKQLADIQERLEDLEETAHKIEGHLHDEYTSEIKTGITLYRLALDTKDPDAKTQHLYAAVEKIIEGIEKTIPAMRRDIEAAPDPKSSYLELIPGVFRTRKVLEKARRQITHATDCFGYSILGIQALCEISFLLENPEAVEGITLGFLQDMMNAGVREAVQKARLVPVEEDSRPEVIFEAFYNNYPELRAGLQSVMQQRIQGGQNMSYLVELIPGDIGLLEGTE